MTGTGATKHSPSPAHTDDAVILLDIRAQRWGALPQADHTPWNGDPELKVLCWGCCAGFGVPAAYNCLGQAASAVRDQGWGCLHAPLPPSLQRVKCQFQVSLR